MAPQRPVGANPVFESPVNDLAAIACLGENMDQTLVKAIVKEGYNNYMAQCMDSDTPFYSPAENIALVTTPPAENIKITGGTSQ